MSVVWQVDGWASRQVGMKLGHLKYIGEKVGEKKQVRVGGWEGGVLMWLGGSKKKSQHFFWEVQGLRRRENKSNYANHLGLSWLTKEQESIENQQPSIGLSIQMVHSWCWFMLAQTWPFDGIMTLCKLHSNVCVHVVFMLSCNKFFLMGFLMNFKCA